MNLLIVDKSAEGQQRVVRRVESFNQSDLEMLDVHMKLVLDSEFIDQVELADVLILGSDLGDQGPQIARTALARKPWLHVVMYVTEVMYSGGAFRAAHSAGVRKVLLDSASYLDLLQELHGILADFRREGRVREGRVICVTHAKGGTGATTMCAALAEVCSVNKRKTLLWDLDVETRDLCRSLIVSGQAGRVVDGWVNGSVEISRNSLAEALVPVSEEVSVLMPPESMAEAMDLVCHTDGMAICQKVLDIARVSHDVIIIDTAGRIGPATGVLMRGADEVVVVIDDTVLGLTALDLFLGYAKALVVGSDRLAFLVNGYSGSLLAVPQIKAELEPSHSLGERPWRFPPVPVDRKASLWPGSGKGFYRLGQRSTRAALEEIAGQLELIEYADTGTESGHGKSRWWDKLLVRKETGKLESSPAGRGTEMTVFEK